MRLAAAVAAVAVIAVSAECPNGCSGHGDCGAKDACTCYVGFDGPDCSQRRCPSGLAFVDVPRGDLNHDGVMTLTASAARVADAYSKVQWSQYKQYEYWPSIKGTLAYKTSAALGDIDPLATTGGAWAAATDEAHFYSECSGKGLCDRTSGTCACFDGYTGSACQRSVCPNSCSGRGVCRTISTIASSALNKRFVSSTGGTNYYQGVVNNFNYRLWDADKNSACVCDPGFTGPDCSMRECPRGDDPLTATTSTCGNAPCQPEIQGFTLSTAAANNNKNYRIRFNGFNGGNWVTSDFKIQVDTTSSTAMAANALAVKNALESLPRNRTGLVTVSSAADILGNLRILVTFTTLPGNVPEFIVERSDVNPGVTPIAQPSQPIQTFFSVTVANGNSVSFSLFPQDITGFRATQFTSAAAATSTGSTSSALTTAATTALLGASNGPSAFLYKYGTSGATVAGTTVAGANALVVILPDKNMGAQPASLVIAGTTYKGVLDTQDGNQEYVMCSNRGICDYTAGLCQCFSGYVGDACQTQNALAM